MNMWIRLDIVALVYYVVMMSVMYFLHRNHVRLYLHVCVKYGKLIAALGIVASVYLIVRHPWYCLLWFTIGILGASIYGYIRSMRVSE